MAPVQKQFTQLGAVIDEGRIERAEKHVQFRLNKSYQFKG